MQEISSLPAGLPRWIGARPHLAGTLILWRNAWRCRRKRILLFAGLFAAGFVVVAGLPPTRPILGWLGRNWAVTFVIAACVFTLSTARRRQRATLEAARSWLASLPAASPARLRVLAAAAGWLTAIVAFTALALGVGVIDRAVFSRLAIAAAAGAVVGLLAGWRLPRAGVGAPGFHHAIVRRPRARWASAPSLAPLACWPAAQGRIFSRPKRTAPLLLLVMLAIPSSLHGASGQVALAVAGACVALFSIFALCAAAARVAPAAARWLAPTIVCKWRFIRALIWRVVLTQALVLAVLILLASVIDLPRALGVGVPLAALYLCASLAVAAMAALRACRRTGLGAAGRGG
ncbi:MAG: hypothetical protein ACRETZ_12455 [Steroidobacteraceae bacterium]